MKKTILIQFLILFAFSTISIAQGQPHLRTKKDISLEVTPMPPGNSQFSLTGCSTNFMLEQPDNGSIRTIEAVTQGYKNNEETCVFDVKLYVPMHLPTPTDIQWKIDGVKVPGDKNITVPVPENSTTVVSVTFMIGSQQGAASRTFLAD